MYGVDAEVMRRMQRRIKEKIYREMIQEEEKQRRKEKEERAKSRQFQFRNLTQPNDRNSRRAKPNLYEDDQPNSLVEQESSFLPIINRRHRPSIEKEADNSSYKEYLQRRHERAKPQRSRSRYNERSSTSAALPTDYQEEGQESEEEKAEKYLSQCQQIISNLREITKKNSKKADQREVRYEPPSPQFASKNKSFNGTLTPKEPIRESMTHSTKGNQPISLRIVRPNQPKNEDIGNEFEGLNLRKSMAKKEAKEEDQSNEFYQFQQSPSKFPPKVNTRKLSPFQTPLNEVESVPNKSGSRDLQNKAGNRAEGRPEKKQKARENFKRLSPIKAQAQEPENQSSKGEEEGSEERVDESEEQDEERPKDKKAEKDQSSKKEPKTSTKPQQIKQEDEAQDQEPTDDASSSPKPGNQSKKEKEKLQKQKARQKAIVKYLKKARMRGNILYQKMESQKPGQQEGGDQPAEVEPQGAEPGSSNPSEPK